jgi:hypothetical protein
MSENSKTQKRSQLDSKLGYSRREAAALLGISKESIDKLAKRGLLCPCVVFRRKIFSRKELERFLDEHTEGLL